MKSFVLKIVNWKLRLLAKATLLKYDPFIIGVTGSVGKTSTKRAIYAALQATKASVRMAGGNLNSEAGLPLAILGDYTKAGGGWFYVGAIWRGFWQLLPFVNKEAYPEILVLEYGADHPNDLDYLIDIAKPDIVVITAIGELPVHAEFYESVEAIQREKSKLAEAVGVDGVSILNADDPRVMKIRGRIKSKTYTYGTNKTSDLRISDVRSSRDGLSFNINLGGVTKKVQLNGVVGAPHAYAIAAGISVGLSMNLSIDELINAVGSYEPEPGRSILIKGVNNSLIIDDSYNAAPLSVEEALHTLSDFKKQRKVVVLGDMLELGDLTKTAHIRVGHLISEVASVSYTIGDHSKETHAVTRGAGIDSYHFSNPESALDEIRKNIKPNDIILVKGSQSMRTEKIVKGLMATPEKAGELLVRQYGRWTN